MGIDIFKELIKKQKHLESRLRKLRKIEIRIMKKLITIKQKQNANLFYGRYAKLSSEEKKARSKIRFLENPKYQGIIAMWNNDFSHTLQTVSDEFLMTRERVRQILNRAKGYGVEVRSYKERVNAKKLIEVDNIKDEVAHALSVLYGTQSYYEWKSNFTKFCTASQRKYFKKQLRAGWVSGELDPLFNYRCDAQLKSIHFKVLQLRDDKFKLEEICKFLNISKPTLTNYLRDLKTAGLYEAHSDSQVDAVSLKKEEVDNRLNLIRYKIIEGEPLHSMDVGVGSVPHFIVRHFLKPYFFNQDGYGEQNG